MRGEHVVDGVVVLLGQDGQFARLLLLQPLQNGLVVRLGRRLQQVVPQGLVLTGLDLARVLELLFDLKLLGLTDGKTDNRNREGGGKQEQHLTS